MLADKQTDLVLVATPNDVHKELVIAALEAGKNVVCEKPVTLCSEDLKEMRAAAERTGKFFTVHQNRRWDEDYLTVKKILEEGKLGEVFRIESRVHGSRGIPGDWRQEKEKGGGTGPPAIGRDHSSADHRNDRKKLHALRYERDHFARSAGH